ncbi:DUF4912 domain-containing protein [Planctomicrobium sp. SH664]|uniref:DUF4912 domain-containing protein n=1 Tax=Planctomicrobium sp. SH664 TaxID=3448125 RepID=UPI003F5B0476
MMGKKGVQMAQGKQRPQGAPGAGEASSFDSPTGMGKTPPSRTNTAASGREDPQADRLEVVQAGESWLHVRWTVSARTLERAHSSMGRDGFRRRQVLRLHRVDQDETGPRAKVFASEVEIPEEAREWFLAVPRLQAAWAVEIGFVFGKERFFSLLHTTPIMLVLRREGNDAAREVFDPTPLTNLPDAGLPPPLTLAGRLLVLGQTRPAAQLTIDDQPVAIDPQTGQFRWELSLANGRRVLPIIVSDRGKLQRALLAVDVNFHILPHEVVDED